MSSKLQPVRGTHDILPADSARWRWLTDTALKVAGLYNYHELVPPIFEFTEVFKRTLGETTDVVTKEMYTFDDRGGESLTLRPELTAGIARAFMSNGLTQNLPIRAIAIGPAFRYERPQKGRMRQFHQIDVECLGIAGPEADIEVIAIGAHLLDAIGLKDKVQLEINTLGDGPSRQSYREALITYFRQHHAALSEESKERLEKNPLRILDSKDPGDKALVVNAPQADEHMTPEARKFFDTVLEGLTALGIPYVRNARLVRGLDYYCHTVFEFTTQLLGAQNAVLSGGRYDGLIGTMGGPETPGIGWAAGMERLLDLSPYAATLIPPVAVIAGSEALRQKALVVARDLRYQDVVTEVLHGGNLGKALKKADKLGAIHAVILGEDECSRGNVAVKHLPSGNQKEIPESEILSHVTQH